MKKIVGIDLDGALLNSKQLISDKDRDALKNQASDTFTFICSGRDVNDIKSILNDHSLNLVSVGLNGAIAYDQDQLLFEYSFDEGVIDELYEVLKEYPIKVYTNQGSFESEHYKDHLKETFYEIGNEFSIEELEYELDYEKSVQSKSFKTPKDLSTYDNLAIYKLFTFIPNRNIKSIIKEKLSIFDVNVTESSEVNLEIIPSQVSKGKVFDYLEDIYKLTDTQRYAIGDSLNDLSLFEASDVSFAMDNAHPKIKEIASYTTLSNDNGGVSEAFKTIKKHSQGV